VVMLQTCFLSTSDNLSLIMRVQLMLQMMHMCMKVNYSLLGLISRDAAVLQPMTYRVNVVAG